MCVCVFVCVCVCLCVFYIILTKLEAFSSIILRSEKFVQGGILGTRCWAVNLLSVYTKFAYQSCV